MFSSRQNVGLLVAGFFVGLLVRSLVSWWSLGQFFLEKTLCQCAKHHQWRRETSPTLALFIGIIFLSDPAKSDHCLLCSLVILSVSAAVEFCSFWICQSCNMDFFKLFD